MRTFVAELGTVPEHTTDRIVGVEAGTSSERVGISITLLQGN